MHTRWNGCDVVKWIFRCHPEHNGLFEHVLLNIVAGLIMSYTKTKFFVHFKCGEVQNDVRILWSVGECKHHAIKWLIISVSVIFEQTVRKQQCAQSIKKSKNYYYVKLDYQSRIACSSIVCVLWTSCMDCTVRKKWGLLYNLHRYSGKVPDGNYLVFVEMLYKASRICFCVAEDHYIPIKCGCVHSPHQSKFIRRKLQVRQLTLRLQE